MKALLTLIATLGFSLSTLATTDGVTVVYLLTHDYNSSTYDVVGYQYTGCYGIEQGPQTASFTEPFLVSAPRGCGSSTDWQEDVNALSCAESEYTWNEEYTHVSALELDTSKCEVSPENKKEFQVLAKKAAQKNFPYAKITLK